ncbi:hypothetical protein FI667_g1888, partial [Globisporangium splendens]
MFFANGYVETEQRRMPPCSNEEHDILRELLLEGEFSSPHHFALTPSKPMTSTLLRSTPSLLNRNISSFPSPSPRASTTQQQQSPQQQLPSSIINSIISPPRVFIQEFGRFPSPFSHEAVSAVLESDLQHDAKQQQPTPKAVVPPPFITSCSPSPPLPMLTMPPMKKKKTPSANSIERKQLRCSYPDCPNLRCSAGFCNRHSAAANAPSTAAARGARKMDAPSSRRRGDSANPTAMDGSAISADARRTRIRTDCVGPTAVRLLRMPQVGAAVRLLLCTHENGAKWKQSP